MSSPSPDPGEGTSTPPTSSPPRPLVAMVSASPVSFQPTARRLGPPAASAWLGVAAWVSQPVHRHGRFAARLVLPRPSPSLRPLLLRPLVLTPRSPSSVLSGCSHEDREARSASDHRKVRCRPLPRAVAPQSALREDGGPGSVGPRHGGSGDREEACGARGPDVVCSVLRGHGRTRIMRRRAVSTLGQSVVRRRRRQRRRGEQRAERPARAAGGPTHAAPPPPHAAGFAIGAHLDALLPSPRSGTMLA